MNRRSFLASAAATPDAPAVPTFTVGKLRTALLLPTLTTLYPLREFELPFQRPALYFGPSTEATS